MTPKLETSSMEKHEGEAVCVVFYKNHVFSGGADGKVKVWDSNLKLKRTIDMHDAYIYCMAISGSGKLYSSCCDGSLKFLKEPADGENIEELVRCDDAIQSMYCDGDLLYTGDEKGVVTKWENDKMLFKYNIVEEVKSMVVENTFIYTVRDLDVVVSDALPGKSGKYANKAVFPGRAPIALIGPMIDNKRAFLCHADRSGKGLVLTKNLPGEKFATLWEALDCHEMIINSICGNETWIYSAGYDGKIKGWTDVDKTKPKLIGEVDVGNCVNSICCSDAGAVYAACSDGTVKKVVFS